MGIGRQLGPKTRLENGMNRPERIDRRQWMAEALAANESRLLRYAARVTGDGETARDVVQETFARLWSQNPAELNGKLVPWLYTVCRRCALDVRRKERRMTSVSDLALLARPSGMTSASEAAIDREETSGMLKQLMTLSETQQEVVRLKFQDGLSYREISQVTGHSVSHVGVLLHTALKTLREKMCGTGY